MIGPGSFRFWLLQIIVVSSLLALLLWLGLRPKTPTYIISDFNLQNATLSFNLEIQNPNRDSSIYYDDILLMFNCNEDTIGQRTKPHFHQGKNKRHTIRDQVEVNAKVWRTLSNAISNGTSEVKADLNTRIQYKTVGIKSKHHKLHMEGILQIGSDGKLYKKKKIKLKHSSKKLRIKFT